jgi:hypothetical protein
MIPHQHSATLTSSCIPESAGGGADRPCRAVRQKRARGLGRGREENVARVGGKVEAGSDPEPVPRKGSPLMKRRARNKSVFEQIKSGLEDGIAYFRGELSLVTTRLPAPPPGNPRKRHCTAAQAAQNVPVRVCGDAEYIRENRAELGTRIARPWGCLATVAATVPAGTTIGRPHIRGPICRSAQTRPSQ